MGRQQPSAKTPERTNVGSASHVPTSEVITLTAENGEPIKVRKWVPDADHDKQIAVLIAPAMATPSSFYTRFAEWLVGQGYHTYSFDYQGYGFSARGPLKTVRADLLDWANDTTTVASWVKNDAAGLPFVWLAHSLGGQLMPFARDEHGELLPDRAVLVGVGTGYWGHAEGRDRVMAPLLWYAIAPVTTRLLGYYPGEKLRVLGNLPGPVMRQWTKWCRNPEYLWGVMPEHVETFASVTIPVTTLTFTDDETMSAAASAHLESYYSGAQLRSLRYTPTELGADRIGHMGFFRPKHHEIWRDVLLPLLDGAE